MRVGCLFAAAVSLGCSSTVDATESATCRNFVDDLAVRLSSPSGERVACSIVVRVHQATLRPVGYQYFCGPYAPINDAQARRLASEQMIPYVNERLTMINAPMPEDAYVFYASPSDFGGIVAVSKRLGRTVFAGSVVWAGRGDVLFPTEWRSPVELGLDCDHLGGTRAFRGYDLERGSVSPTTTIYPAIRAVERTGLLAAVLRSGLTDDAVVFPYARSSGGLDDADAEWIVVINSHSPQ